MLGRGIRLKNCWRFLGILLCMALLPWSLAVAEEVIAYRNNGIGLVVNGVSVPLANAPIMCDGQLYMPADALTAALGEQGTWDAANGVYVIGGQSTKKDFIEDFMPYEHDGKGFQVIRKMEHRTLSVAGREIDHWLRLYDSFTGSAVAYYNLGGAFTQLTLSGYYDGNGTAYIDFLGDNDTVLSTISMVGHELPQTYTINLTNVYRLVIKTNRMSVFLFDATIE